MVSSVGSAGEGIWSREMGLAAPFRVSLLNSILRLNMVLTYGIPSDYGGGVRLLI